MSEKKKSEEFAMPEVHSMKELIDKRRQLDEKSNAKYSQQYRALNDKYNELSVELTNAEDNELLPYQEAFQAAREEYEKHRSEINGKYNDIKSEKLNPIYKEQANVREARDIEENAIKSWYKREQTKLQKKVISDLDKGKA